MYTGMVEKRKRKKKKKTHFSSTPFTREQRKILLFFYYFYFVFRYNTCTKRILYGKSDNGIWLKKKKQNT